MPCRCRGLAGGLRSDSGTFFEVIWFCCQPEAGGPHEGAGIWQLDLLSTGIRPGQAAFVQSATASPPDG